MDSGIVRKQIYISKEEDKLLKQEAYIEGVPQTEVIRKALNHYLHRGLEKAEKLGGKGKAMNERAELLSSFVGALGKAELPRDLAANHDRYLYGKEHK